MQQFLGKVIGEFVCDSITEWRADPQSKGYFITMNELALTQLTYGQLHEYGNGQALYGWHISDLVTYDKPKELSEFVIQRKITTLTTEHSIEGIVHYPQKKYIFEELTRPPQSWCYVEELKGGCT